MPKKRFHRLIRYKDSAMKNIRKIREKIDLSPYIEFQKTISRPRKQPPQYDPHK